MKKTRWLAAMLTGILTISLLAGCGGSGSGDSKEEGSSDGGGDGYTIATVVKDMSDPWCLRHEVGVKEYADETGYDAYVKGPAKTDSAEQIRVIEQLIETDIDALCVVPIDPEACAPVLQKAMDKGIVVITHEAEGNSTCDYDLEAFNNKEYGEAMMQGLAEAMGEEGKYVTMVAFLSSTSHNDWMDAAVAYQKEHYPNMELIPEERIECEDNMDMAYEKAKEIITKYPDIKGFIGASSYDPPGAAKAIDELNLTGQAYAVGTGVASVSGPYLESGSNPCVFCWDPALSGKAMCKIAEMILDGKQDEIATGLDLGFEGYDNLTVEGNTIKGNAVLRITKENMADYDF